MKNLNLNKYGVQEINAGEIAKVDGGSLSIVVAEGFLDGVSGNEHLWLFGIKLF
ncbi:MAG: hypothetical protein PHT07_18135 [Paludibacter sp.]|nr:hypothetical protein [Paludibacter sp.]